MLLERILVKVKLSKKDVIWSYVGTIMSLFANVLLIPVLVYFLDREMLGLWYIFSSVGGIAILFDFGFNVTFSRNITYCWSGAGKLEKENVAFTEENRNVDFRLMKNVLATCKSIYLMISLLALIIMLTAGTSYIMFVSEDIKGNMHVIAWFVYTAAVFMNLYFGYYSSFLRGVGAVGDVNINTIIARCVQIGGTVLFLALGMNLVGASLAYLLYGTVFRILGKRKFYAYQGIGEKLKSAEGKIDKTERKRLFGIVWHNAWREGLVALANYGSNEATTLICSLYLSLAETGVYSLGVQLATAISTVSATLYSAYQPELQSAYVTQNTEKVKKIMSLIVISYIVLFGLGTLAVVFIGLPILRLIKPETVVTVTIFIGLSLYQFILKFRNCYTSYFSTTNRLIYYKAFIVSAIVSIVLSFVLLDFFNMGMVGLIVAQVVSQLMYNAWYWTFKAHKEMGLRLPDVFKLSIDEAKVLIRKF